MWFRNHPYAAASAGAGLLLIIGALIVESRVAVQPGRLSVWGGSGAPLLNPTSYTPGEIVGANIRTEGNSDVSPVYIPPSQTGDQPAQDDSRDYESMLRTLVDGNKSTKGTVDESGETSLAYSLIPRGLIATSTPTEQRDEAQQRLYNYGNDAASYIQTYEDGHRGAPATLQEQTEDRQNPQKKQAVKQIAAAIRNVGENLRGMEEVPEGASAAHAALAESYIAAGEKLALIPDAASDEALVNAIGEYNGAVDALGKNFVAVSLLFSLSGVTFSSQDPGSIFMFSGGGGL